MSTQAPVELSIGSDANLLDNEEAKDDQSDDRAQPEVETGGDGNGAQPVAASESQETTTSVDLQFASPHLVASDMSLDDEPSPGYNARPSVIIHDEFDPMPTTLENDPMPTTFENTVALNISPRTIGRAQSLEHQASTVSTGSTFSAKSTETWDEREQPDIDLSPPVLRNDDSGKKTPQRQASPQASPRMSIAKNFMDIKLETEGMNDVSRPGRSEAWCSPTRCMDFLMHKFLPGKILLLVFNWLPVMDYAKDMYVAEHLFATDHIMFACITVGLMYLSLRVMLLVRATDETITIWKLLYFYFPGSVYCDFQIDRRSDYAVCACWELLVDLGTPLMPFYLTYLAGNKTVSMLCGDTNFEHPHLLSFTVVECLFETLPQFGLQMYLRLTNDGVSSIVFDIALAISLATLFKIPFIIYFNWRIVHKLEFKRRHNGEVTAICFHPSRDLVATCSWDHTVIINNIVVDIVKAKRVLDHHYNVNAMCFSHDGHFLAVGGQGVELWDWASGHVVDHYPKPPRRDRIGRRQRVRTDEVAALCFSLDNEIIFTAEGKFLVAYEVSTKEVLRKIRAQHDRLGQIKALAMSPNGRYLAVALYVGIVKIWDTRTWKQVRRLTGHTSEVACVTFDRTGQFLLTGSADTTLRVWDFQRGKCIAMNEGHDSEVTCVCVDYENKMVLSGSRDRTLRLYNFFSLLDDYLGKKSELEEKDREMRPKTHSKTYSSSTLRRKKDIELLPEMQFILSRKQHDRDVLCAQFSPFDDIFISAGEDHNVHLFKIPPDMVPASKS